MKKLVVSYLLMLLVAYNGFCNISAAEEKDGKSDTLRILVDVNYRNMAEEMADLYKSQGFGDVVISSIDKITGSYEEAGNADLLISDLRADGYTRDKASYVLLGRELIVAVVSEADALASRIAGSGLSRNEMQLLLRGELTNWNVLYGSDYNKAIDLVCMGKKTLSAMEKNFMEGGQAVKQVATDSDVSKFVSYLHRHPGAVGLCRLEDIREGDSNRLVEGIMVIPFDINNNNVVDHFEDCYNDYASIARAAWIGKYPSIMINRINILKAGGTINDARVSEFIAWALGNNGQEIVKEEGFTPLQLNESSGQLYAFTHSDSLPGEDIITPVRSAGVALVVIALVFLSLLAFFTRILSSRGKADSLRQQAKKATFREEEIVVPAGILFDSSHTWTFMEKGGSVLVGIGDFLQHVTGRLNRLELRKEGDHVKRGEKILTLIQDGKHLDIYSPLTGTISEVNISLSDDAGPVRTSAYDEGWVYRVMPEKWEEEAKSYMMGIKYRGWISKELTRLKDFISSVSAGAGSQAIPVMQDGGVLAEGILETMSPLVWDDFQTIFIDRSK